MELGVDLDYEGGRRSTRHAPELETTIYRLVQEALNNALSHGNAPTVRIEVVEYEETITIVVADNGTGFDTAKRTEGFGLLGMRERVELAEGTLTITSESGQGTTVLATLPARHQPQP